MAILVKRGSVNNVNPVLQDGTGRVLALEFEFQNVLFKLINLYASNVETDRKEMFKW